MFCNRKIEENEASLNSGKNGNKSDRIGKFFWYYLTTTTTTTSTSTSTTTTFTGLTFTHLFVQQSTL